MIRKMRCRLLWRAYANTSYFTRLSHFFLHKIVFALNERITPKLFFQLTGEKCCTTITSMYPMWGYPAPAAARIVGGLSSSLEETSLTGTTGGVGAVVLLNKHWHVSSFSLSSIPNSCYRGQGEEVPGQGHGLCCLGKERVPSSRFQCSVLGSHRPGTMWHPAAGPNELWQELWGLWRVYWTTWVDIFGHFTVFSFFFFNFKPFSLFMAS